MYLYLVNIMYYLAFKALMILSDNSDIDIQATECHVISTLIFAGECPFQWKMSLKIETENSDFAFHTLFWQLIHGQSWIKYDSNFCIEIFTGGYADRMLML